VSSVIDVAKLSCATVNGDCVFHKDEVTACRRIASDGKASQEVRSFSTMTSGLLALADWLTEAECTHVAMEATGVYWKPVWHVLEGSFELVLANAQHVRNLPGRKSDVNDAMWLADLLAHGLVRGSFVPPTPVQEMRDLTRTRKQLVREIAQHTHVGRMPVDGGERSLWAFVIVLSYSRALWGELVLGLSVDSLVPPWRCPARREDLGNVPRGVAACVASPPMVAFVGRASVVVSPCSQVKQPQRFLAGRGKLDACRLSRCKSRMGGSYSMSPPICPMAPKSKSS